MAAYVIFAALGLQGKATGMEADDNYPGTVQVAQQIDPATSVCPIYGSAQACKTIWV
jgi:hypothetical protein